MDGTGVVRTDDARSGSRAGAASRRHRRWALLSLLLALPVLVQPVLAQPALAQPALPVQPSHPSAEVLSFDPMPSLADLAHAEPARRRKALERLAEWWPSALEAERQRLRQPLAAALDRLLLARDASTALVETDPGIRDAALALLLELDAAPALPEESPSPALPRSSGPASPWLTPVAGGPRSMYAPPATLPTPVLRAAAETTAAPPLDAESNADSAANPPAALAPSAESKLAALEARIHALESERAEWRKARPPESGTSLMPTPTLAADPPPPPAAEPRKPPEEPTIQWTAQVQSDTYLFNQSPANAAEYGDMENGTAFRRARLGVLGDYGPFAYRLEADLALAGRPSLLDAHVGLRDLPLLGRVRVGHFTEPFLMERATPNRFTLFLERTAVDQAFAPAFNWGVMVDRTWADDRGSVAYGFFRSSSDVWGDDVGDNLESALTGRVTWLVSGDPTSDPGSAGDCKWHVGMAGSLRGADNEIARFRAQPEARLAASTNDIPFFADTGNIAADYYGLMSVETAVLAGPLTVAAEYVLTPVASQDLGTRLFHGGYVQAGYFLTGDARPYRSENGTFGRVLPGSDFIAYHGDPKNRDLQFGTGAVEVVGRASYLNLNDGPIRGGAMTDLTLGLNWYLNRYVRYTLNYTHCFVQHPGGGDSEADILGMRVGFEF